ncbi:hypothetical protein ASD79_03185 [Caulobacter sp. Root655]|uniref:hypothetical protein n=1 Tax=Caulobacter sp. Root655 TaxID=1736578 RepID=UPI0006F6F768|nr:hypothetical protein [Caulobacter sp. Root655]KRA66298.1 hypothetical protein ASD79_03185 [Caulobacter sp. Root655]
MNHHASLVLAFALVAVGLGAASGAMARSEDPSAAVIEGLTSTLPAGVISIQADPTLSNGRLVLRVAAFNRTATPAAFSDKDVQLYTAAGQPVALLSLDSLIAEVSKPSSAPTVGAATGYGGPAMTTGQDGRLDVSGFSGANQTVAGGLSTQVQAQIATPNRKLGKAAQAQVDGLRAAILQPTQIAPSQAAGGQVVSEKLKFDRKAPRDLKLVVRFNGETHGFAFTAPPAR